MVLALIACDFCILGHNCIYCLSYNAYHHYIPIAAIMDEGLVITKGAMAHHKLGTMQAALSSAMKNESFEPDGSV